MTPPGDLPNLDYAFLADYAKIDANGTLTSVGASFTIIQTPELPATQLLSVAGRLRMAEDSKSVSLSFVFAGPASPRIALEIPVAPENAVPYDGKVGVLFVATTLVPLMSEGLHTVTISIADRQVRLLAFEVKRAPAAMP